VIRVPSLSRALGSTALENPYVGAAFLILALTANLAPDDPDPVGDNVRAHGFEELEEEEGVNALEEEVMEVGTDEM